MDLNRDHAKAVTFMITNKFVGRGTYGSVYNLKTTDGKNNVAAKLVGRDNNIIEDTEYQNVEKAFIFI